MYGGPRGWETNVVLQQMLLSYQKQVGPIKPLGPIPDDPAQPAIDFTMETTKLPKERLLVLFHIFMRGRYMDRPRYPYVSYLWDFGDETTSDLWVPNKIYTEFGTYTVKLKLTDDKGNVTVLEKKVVYES